MQDVVSEAVIERTESQLRLQLDGQASHVEEKLQNFTATIVQTQKEMERCMDELQQARQRVWEH